MKTSRRGASGRGLVWAGVKTLELKTFSGAGGSSDGGVLDRRMLVVVGREGFSLVDRWRVEPAGVALVSLRGRIGRGVMAEPESINGVN